MKTQQELQLYYWGTLHDMVKEYNAKHGCDVKPWECVRTPISQNLIYDYHPQFNDPRINAYTFAPTILYDDKRKEHRPVFVGSELYYKEKLITVAGRMKGEDYLRDGLLNSYETGLLSWNPPTPKRTFKLNDVELPCPERRDEGGFLTNICGESFLFDTSHDCNDFKTKLMSLLTAARDKE